MPKESVDDTKQAKAIAIGVAEQVYHYKLIARSVNRDEDTLLNWRKNDPVFSDRLQEARTRFLHKKMKIAKPEFLLERLEPEIFGAPKSDNSVTFIFNTKDNAKKYIEHEPNTMIEAKIVKPNED